MLSERVNVNREGLAMLLRVKNFEKYNSRNGVKKPSWFRFEHSFIHDDKFDDFTCSEMIAWVVVLCIRSEKNTDVISVSAKKLGVLSKIRTSLAEKCLSKFIATGLIEEVANTDMTQTCYRDDTDMTQTCYRDDTEMTQTCANRPEQNQEVIDDPRTDPCTTLQDKTEQDITTSYVLPSIDDPSPGNELDDDAVVSGNDLPENGKDSWDGVDLSIIRIHDPTCTRQWLMAVKSNSLLTAEMAQESIDRYLYDCYHRKIPNRVRNPIGWLTEQMQNSGYNSISSGFSKEAYRKIKVDILRERMTAV